MEFLRLLICLAVTVLIGYSVLAIIMRRTGFFTLPEKLALSYGAGIGAIALQMLIYYFFQIPYTILNLLVFWVPVVAVAVATSRSSFVPFILRSLSCIFPKIGVGGRPSSLLKNKGSRILEKFLIGAISIEVILAFLRAFMKPIESFDSIAIYAVRAKAIFLSGMIPPDFFSKITLRFPNPDYPLLIPLAQVWVYTFLGGLNDLLVKAIFPMYFLSFLILFFFVLRKFVPEREALLFTFVLATIPQFNRFATNGYTDLPLAYYYAAGAMYLFLSIKEENPRYLMLSAAFSGFAMLTKNEGYVLFLANIVMLALSFAGYRGRKSVFLRRIFLFVITAIVICLPWLVIRTSNRLENDLLKFGSFGFERIQTAFQKIERIPVILYEYQKQFFGPKKWNIVWILFLSLFLLNIKRAFTGDHKYFIVPLLLVFAAYGAVYMLIPVDGPINWNVASTVSRLFIHIVPVAVFWMALACRERSYTEGL